MQNWVKFVKFYLDHPTIWPKVIFLDKKKFNLDGPDGIQYYWYNLRKETEMYSKRVNGGGGFMIWAGFSVHSKTELAFLDTKVNSAKYVAMLEKTLLPFACGTYEKELGDFYFQQDNAPIHVSKEANKWFDDRAILQLKWPAKLPDLNPIENLWGYMVRKVYNNGNCQFKHKNELKEALLDVWSNIPSNLLKKLAKSKFNCCIAVTGRQGKNIHY